MLQTGLQQEYMCQGWSKEKGSTSRVTFLKKKHTPLDPNSHSVLLPVTSIYMYYNVTQVEYHSSGLIFFDN